MEPESSANNSKKNELWADVKQIITDSPRIYFAPTIFLWRIITRKYTIREAFKRFYKG